MTVLQTLHFLSVVAAVEAVGAVAPLVAGLGHGCRTVRQSETPPDLSQLDEETGANGVAAVACYSGSLFVLSGTQRTA